MGELPVWNGGAAFGVVTAPFWPSQTLGDLSSKNAPDLEGPGLQPGWAHGLWVSLWIYLAGGLMSDIYQSTSAGFITDRMEHAGCLLGSVPGNNAHGRREKRPDCTEVEL